MGSTDNPLPYPVNENYGNGLYRRRIRLTGSEGQVYGELEDSNHGFCVTVFHDGEKVTGFAPEAKRTPFTTCVNAGKALDNLIGASIHSPSRQLNSDAQPTSNCTHWLDLTVLAIRHAAAGNSTTVWDVVVTDEPEGTDSELTVSKNGEVVHHWTAHMWQIKTPEAFQGAPLFKGFAQWANEQFKGVENDGAFILQKGYFVANARRYDVDAMAGFPATQDKSMHGACYTYSAGQIENAFRTELSTRDFSESDAELLKFT